MSSPNPGPVAVLQDILEQAKSTAQVLSLCCLNANASVQILQTVHQCSSVATTSRSLCTTAATESRELVDLCRTTGGRLQGFRGVAMTSPRIFVQVAELLDSYTEIQQQVEDCTQMKAQAAQVVQQSDRMLRRLETAVASVPSLDVREQDSLAAAEDDTGDRQATDRTLLMGSKDPIIDSDDDDEEEDDETTRDLIGILQNIDVDIADLENSASKTRGGALDLFSASSLGAHIFDESARKGELCATLFANMNDVCGSIQSVSRSTAEEDAMSCCSKFKTVVGGMKGLVRCQHLVEVLNWAAKAVLRMVEAIAQLIQESWAKIQNFANQFSATKKIGKFMGKVNTAFKKGQIPTGAFSSFMKQSAGASRGFLLQ